MKDGIYYKGIVKAIVRVQRNQYEDINLALVTSTYQGRYGDTQENIVEVRLTPEQANVIPSDITGKAVLVPVQQKVMFGVSAKTQKPYGFLVSYIPKEESIQILSTRQSSAA